MIQVNERNTAISKARPARLAAPVPCYLCRGDGGGGGNLPLGLLLPYASSSPSKGNAPHAIRKADRRAPHPEHAPHCPEKSAKDRINWVPTLSVEMKLDSVGARLRAGPRRPSFWRGRGVWPTRTPVRVERRGEGGGRGGGSGRESS